jgi:HlyD family secretion protein
MEVTSSRAWIALGALCLLLVLVVGWGLTGTLPTKVHSTGILMRSGGLAEVAATAHGQITALEVHEGDTIKAGQVVARLAQPELDEERMQAESRLAELKTNQARMGDFGSRDSRMRSQEIGQRRSRIQGEISGENQRAIYLEEKVQTQIRLLEQGLITRGELQSTNLELRRLKENIRQLQGQLLQTGLDALGAERQTESEVQASSYEIAEAERKLNYLIEKQELYSRVVSTHNGRVLEVRAGSGDIVNAGSTILSMELAGEEEQPLEAIIFVPSTEGKRIEPGMVVHISPSVVRREEHGVVLGIVQFVAEFPSSKKGMMQILENEQLVQSYLEQTKGMPIAIRVQLQRKKENPSGYAWSSGTGPEIRLTTGTPCTASVTTDRQRPITLVMPFLKGVLGG